MKVLLVIPVVNVEKTILQVVEQIKKLVPKVDYLVVDHGSTDRTIDLLDNNNMTYLSTPLPTSYSQAFKIGLRYAQAQEYQAVVEFDGANFFEVSDIRKLTEQARKNDFVLATRFTDAKRSKKRRWPDKILTWALKRSTRRHVSDPILRFRLYKLKTLETLIRDDTWSGPDAIALLLMNQYLFTEVGVSLKINTPDRKYWGLYPTRWRRWMQVLRWLISILVVQRLKRSRAKHE